MTESLLYYLWQFKRWDGELKTTDGNVVKIISPGIRNHDAGPDFLNAKIKIDNVDWYGNIEIHVNSSDWLLHQHQKDSAYKHIILHVVYENDCNENFGNFPTLALKDFLNKEVIDNYKKINQPYHFIPCEKQFGGVGDFIKKSFYESLFVERLNRKSEFWQNRLVLLNGNWEALLFEAMAYAFGLKINAEPFHLLAKSFPFKIIQEIHRKKESVESLLLGQAGFLAEPKDDYTQELLNQYKYLQHKYQLNGIENNLFKFLRLRPPNFPPVRLAQLAAMYETKVNWFHDLIIQDENFNNLNLLQEIQTSTYWDTHYTLGKVSNFQPKRISKSLNDILKINVIIPIQFLYLKETGQSLEPLIQKVQTIKKEKNSIIKIFDNLDKIKLNMLYSQALLELKKNLCDEKKCLNCRIGNEILKK